MNSFQRLWSRLRVQAEPGEPGEAPPGGPASLQQRLAEALRHETWEDVLEALAALRVVVRGAPEGIVLEGPPLPSAVQAQLEAHGPAVLRALQLRFQARDDSGQTRLHQAWRLDRQSTLQGIAAGADLGAQDRLGRTPLHEAVTHQNLEVVRLLVEAGAPVGSADHSRRTPLHLAAEDGREDIVQALLTAADAPLNAVDHLQRTPLHLAAAHARAGAVRALLAAGAAPELLCRDRHTALALAIERGDGATVQALLDGHADPEAAGAQPSPLQSALAQGRTRLAWRLLLAGARAAHLAGDILTASLEKGDTALLSAALERGIEPGLENGRPLVQAVSQGSLLAVDLLLKAGAPVAPQDNLPLKLAVYHGRHPIAAALKAAGAPVEPAQQMYEVRLKERLFRFTVNVATEKLETSEMLTDEGWTPCEPDPS